MQTMQYLTAAVLAAFVGYVAAWYTGAIEGNLSLLLFLATVVTLQVLEINYYSALPSIWP